MSRKYIEDKTFEKVDFTTEKLPGSGFDNCTFLNCNFSDADLSEKNFTECTFRDCNLSMAKLVKTTLNDVQFKDCKMIGLNFQQCSEFLFTVQFNHSVLNISTFTGMKVKKTKFVGCTLHEVDFSEADLSGSIFDNCDLTRAIFESTILEKTDFRTSYNFSIDPAINKMKKARFSMQGLPGLLEKFDLQID